MVRCWFVIFSCCCLSTTAQTVGGGSSSTDSVSDGQLRRQLLSTRLYWDIGKTAMIWTDFEEKTELGIELLWFERIQLIGEAGMGTVKPDDAFQNGDYTSDGRYFRIGVGYLTPVDLRNKIGLGVRYATANFDDNLVITINSQSGLNETYEEEFIRTSLNASWVEFVLNSEKMLTLNKQNPGAGINRFISLGFLFRYRILLEYDAFQPIDVYTIPGYGRTLNNSLPALNIFLKFRLF